MGLGDRRSTNAATDEVLMVAHMNRAAFEETLATGRAVYFSRSRGSCGEKAKKVVMLSSSSGSRRLRWRRRGF